MQPQKQQLPQMDAESGGRQRSSGFSLEDTASALVQPPLPRETNRAAAIEMDFFSNEKRMRAQPSRAAPAASQQPDHLLDFKVPTLGLAREDIAAVHTGLHLANARSDNPLSTLDDAMPISIDYSKEEREELAELAAMQAELHLITEENQRLRAMIDEVNAKNKALQRVLLTWQHPTPSSSSVNPHEGIFVPRQFIDLGESSNSSTQRSHNNDQFGSSSVKEVIAISFDGGDGSACGNGGGGNCGDGDKAGGNGGAH